MRLDDDDATAAQEVLLALHHKYAYLKDAKSISLSLLIKITVFVDKYELAVPMKPTTEKWVRGLDWFQAGGKNVGETVPQKGMENVLAICWVFGFEGQFEAVARELTTRAEVGKDGGLVFRRGGTGGTKPEIVGLSDCVPDLVIGKKTSQPNGLLIRLANGCAERLIRLRAQRVGKIKASFISIRSKRVYTSSDVKAICKVEPSTETPAQKLRD